jgi:hypothetical protein
MYAKLYIMNVVMCPSNARRWLLNLSNGDPDHVPEMASNDMVLETLLKLMKEDKPEPRKNAVVTIFNILHVQIKIQLNSSWCC